MSNNSIRIDREIKNRFYCVLFALLLVTSRLWAEDDVVDIDPNGSFSILGVLQDLWSFLAGLIG